MGTTQHERPEDTMARALKGQLNIPVPNEIGRKHDPDHVYGELYGAEKLAEQQRLYVEARACTCEQTDDPDAPPFPSKWGVRYGHKPPCPRAGKRF
jgi:hypothetical protein